MDILITAGGTREYLDPVRFISNASSGRMGYALARAALAAGHQVTLIAAPTAQEPPRKARIVKVETTAEMFKAVKKHFRRCDCLIMAAAVADYTPVRPSLAKLKKTGRNLTITLKPTRDILKWAGAQKRRSRRRDSARKVTEHRGSLTRHRLPITQSLALPIVVGFALEDRALRARAEKKLHDKNLDIIVANRPAAIGADNSTVQIKTPHSAWVKIENATKSATTRKIISLVEKLCRSSCRDEQQ